MKRIPEPSRSQWAILEALAETKQLRLRRDRFVAVESAPRSFAFIQVMHLVKRGLVRLTDAQCSCAEPTPLAFRVLAERAARRAPPQRPSDVAESNGGAPC